MKNRLEELKTTFTQRLRDASSLEEIESLRVELLGKKGILTSVLKQLKDLSDVERQEVGGFANLFKKEMIQTIFEAKERVTNAEIEKRIELEKIDVTLPGRREKIGTLHPITRTINLLRDIFLSMGFDVLNGPEIESVYRNFDALNVKEGHPSREESDTFYFDKNTVLRTHTSPVQVRAMENGKVPLSMVSMGKVYRPDYDVSHTPMFHQIEGLAIGPDINFSHLKGVLDGFLKQLFDGNVVTRLRPHFFPFTEPSAEVDISCVLCKGKGCRVCKHSGWLEILGAGMVSPYVLEKFYDIKEVRGFAFGAGIERIAMLKHGIDDIRLFYENDLRFLRQFGFVTR